MSGAFAAGNTRFSFPWATTGHRISCHHISKILMPGAAQDITSALTTISTHKLHTHKILATNNQDFYK
jgi:hypothetical protein